MSKFTKTESTQAIWDALSEETYDYGEPYTLAIEPEIYTEDNETFIYLNMVVIERSTRAIYSHVDGASVELGRYDDDDDETVARAYKKVIKEAKQFDIYVTEPA